MTVLNFIKQQQQQVLKISNILIIIGSCLNLFGLVGIQGSIHRTIIIVYLLIIACFAAMEYIRKYNNFRIMIGFRALAAQLLICIKMIILAHSSDPNSSIIITSHMSVLIIILLVLLLSYLTFFSYFLSLVSVICYTYCAYMLDSPEMWRNISLYIVLFSVCAFLNIQLMKEVNAIINENRQYKVDIQDTLDTLGLTENEFNAYIELSKNKKKGENAMGDIFNILGDRAQETLKKNVTYLMEQDKIVYDKIGEIIPEFTPSEIEIAKLIVKGKKIGDMIQILNKKKSNITCQRTKMRVKLNLSPEDNLRDAILKRVIIE